MTTVKHRERYSGGVEKRGQPRDRQCDRDCIPQACHAHKERALMVSCSRERPVKLQAICMVGRGHGSRFDEVWGQDRIATKDPSTQAQLLETSLLHEQGPTQVRNQCLLSLPIVANCIQNFHQQLNKMSSLFPSEQQKTCCRNNHYKLKVETRYSRVEPGAC